MVRARIALDADLLQQLKTFAAEQRRPMQALANDLLRHALAGRARPSGYRLKFAGSKAKLLPGVDICDRDQLFTRLDE